MILFRMIFGRSCFIPELRPARMGLMSALIRTVFRFMGTMPAFFVDIALLKSPLNGSRMEPPSRI
jgi:hypothetical protein